MSSLMDFGVHLQGHKELERKLLALTSSQLLNVTARATTKAMKPVIAKARQLAPVESRSMRRSIGSKTKKYRASHTVVTVVGARTKMGRVVSIGGRQVYRDPSKYSHLVELGHRVARKGQTLLKRGESIAKGKGRARRSGKRLGSSTGFVAAKPFLRPAFVGQEAKILSVYRAELAAGVEALAKRGRA